MKRVKVISVNSELGAGTRGAGLYESEAFQLVSCLAKQEKVCCMEITEINPTLDNKKNIMAEIALEILEQFTGEIEKRL